MVIRFVSAGVSIYGIIMQLNMAATDNRTPALDKPARATPTKNYFSTIVGIVGVSVTTWGFAMIGHTTTSKEYLPLVSSLGCGMLIFETLHDDRKQRGVDELSHRYYIACILAVMVCWLPEIYGSGGGVYGLLVSLVLNFVTDSLIIDGAAMLVATGMDNIALAYVMGSRCMADVACSGSDEFISIYLPAILYFVIVSTFQVWWPMFKKKYNCTGIDVSRCFKPDTYKTQVFPGAVMGVILYTSIVELAPHIQHEEGNTVSLGCMLLLFVGAPVILAFLDWLEDRLSKRQRRRGAAVVPAPGLEEGHVSDLLRQAGDRPFCLQF